MHTNSVGGHCLGFKLLISIAQQSGVIGASWECRLSITNLVMSNQVEMFSVCGLKMYAYIYIYTHLYTFMCCVAMQLAVYLNRNRRIELINCVAIVGSGDCPCHVHVHVADFFCKMHIVTRSQTHMHARTYTHTLTESPNHDHSSAALVHKHLPCVVKSNHLQSLSSHH